MAVEVGRSEPLSVGFFAIQRTFFAAVQPPKSARARTYARRNFRASIEVVFRISGSPLGSLFGSPQKF